MSRMRPEPSKDSQFWISKHRYYELKHFCLQYHEWEHLYLLAKHQTLGIEEDPTGEYATILADYKHCMDLVERVARGTDHVLGIYIFEHVTNGTTYESLRTIYNIPCGRDYFYNLCRKFFYLLSSEKGV